MIFKKFLSLNSYGHLTDDFQDIFSSHPNYPSLFALTDSLDALSVGNLAIKLPKEHFMDLPEVFMAVLDKNIVLVVKKGDFVAVQSENNDFKKLTVAEFLAGWDGVVVVVEPNAKRVIKLKGNQHKTVLAAATVLALVILSLLGQDHNLLSLCLLATTLLGFVAGVLVIQEKLGFENEVISKLCNAGSSMSCDSVIKSNTNNKQWVSFAELPLLFFGISLVSLLISPVGSGSIIGFAGVLSFPVIAYSIWLQKYEVKKWCPLCLIIASILIVETITVYFLNPKFEGISAIGSFGFLFSAIVVSAIWFFVKPLLENSISKEKEIKNLKKFKRSYAVFQSLTKNITAASEFEQLEGIYIGSNTAEVKLTLILSPTCGHCHTAFKEAVDIAEKFPDKFSIRILFNINPENSDNPYKTVVETLLRINCTDPGQSKEAIYDWHFHNMSLEKWTEKWGHNVPDLQAGEELSNHYNWCLTNKFNFTPVKIINGKKFPNEYEISELRYFLNDISEEIPTAETSLVQI